MPFHTFTEGHVGHPTSEYKEAHWVKAKNIRINLDHVTHVYEADYGSIATHQQRTEHYFHLVTGETIRIDEEYLPPCDNCLEPILPQGIQNDHGLRKCIPAPSVIALRERAKAEHEQQMQEISQANYPQAI